MRRILDTAASGNCPTVTGGSIAGSSMDVNNSSVMQAGKDVERDTDVKELLNKQVCAICAFFLILTVLAVYVMFSYPQTGY